MHTTTTPHRLAPQTSTLNLMLVTTAAFGILGVGLLAAGSASHGIVLLAWGVASAMLSVGTGCMVAVRLMLDGVIRACTEHSEAAINETAVQVAGAVADSLREPSPALVDDTSVRLYS